MKYLRTKTKPLLLAPVFQLFVFQDFGRPKQIEAYLWQKYVYVCVFSGFGSMLAETLKQCGF